MTRRPLTPSWPHSTALEVWSVGACMCSVWGQGRWTPQAVFCGESLLRFALITVRTRQQMSCRKTRM